MKIHIVDDEIEVRESCEFLVNQLDYSLVEQWENGEQFIDGADLFEPAIAILDLRMPKMNGEMVVELLKKKGSVIAPIILTGHGELSQAVTLLKNGAVDFLEKPVSMAKLETALERAQSETEKLFYDYTIQQQFAQLSEREQQVSQLVYEGLTNREIADQLCVSVRTVEVQRSSAMKKLNVETLAEFVVKLSDLKEV